MAEEQIFWAKLEKNKENYLNFRFEGRGVLSQFSYFYSIFQVWLKKFAPLPLDGHILQN